MIDTDRAEPQKFQVVYSNSSQKSNKKRNVQSDGVLTVSKNNSNLTSNINTGYTLVLYDEFDKWICKDVVNDLKVYKNKNDITLKSFEIQIDAPIDCAIATTAAQEKETGKENETLVAATNTAPRKFTGFVPPTLVRSKDTYGGCVSYPTEPRKLTQLASTSNVAPRAPNPLFKQSSSMSSSASSSGVISSNPLISSSSGGSDIDSFLARVLRPHQLEGVQFLLGVMGGLVTEALRNEAIDGDGNKGTAMNASQQDSDSDSDSSGFLEDKNPPKNPSSNPLSSTTAKRYTGAILGDEMGLGKTLQVISVLWTLLKRGKNNKAVIVAPSSLVENWQKEVSKWLGVRMEPLVIKAGGGSSSNIDNDTKVKSFVSGDTAKTRLLIISYDNLRKYCNRLNACKGWDVVVCDEGHRLKNSDGNQTIDALMGCKAKQRIVLTGTPIQNDLDELFAIVSFVCPGYLGSLQYFRNNISRHIIDTSGGRARDEASRALKALLSHIMIRRTQEEVLKKLLPPRTDYVIFCSLTEAQQNQYASIAKSILGYTHQSPSNEAITHEEERDTFEQDDETNVVEVEAEEAVEDDGPRGHLTLTGLQKLRRICIATLDDTNDATTDDKPSTSIYGNKQQSAAPSAAVLTGEEALSALYHKSSKYKLLDAMLHRLRQCHPEEKAVVVASFTSTLDDIASLCEARGYLYLRIDGNVNTANRQGLVDCFNRPSDPRFLFLLGKRSGGQGLNLIGGSRLFMMEPDWNPSVDLQAMSRIWRENQKRLCFIYRFVAAGRIEEAIVVRQLGKGKISDDLFEEGAGKDGPGKEKDLVVSFLEGGVESLIFPKEGSGKEEDAVIEDVLAAVRCDGETGALVVGVTTQRQ